MVTSFDPSKEEGLVGITIRELIESNKIHYWSAEGLPEPPIRSPTPRFLVESSNKDALYSIGDRLTFYVDKSNLSVPLEIKIGGSDGAIVILYPNQPISALTYLGLAGEYPNVESRDGGFNFPGAEGGGLDTSRVEETSFFTFRNEKLEKQPHNSGWGKKDIRHPLEVNISTTNQAREELSSTILPAETRVVIKYG